MLDLQMSSQLLAVSRGWLDVSIVLAEQHPLIYSSGSILVMVFILYWKGRMK